MILFVEDEAKQRKYMGVCLRERDTEFWAPRTELRRWHCIGVIATRSIWLSWT